MIAKDPYFPPVDPRLGGILESEGLKFMGIASAEPDAAAEDRYARWLGLGYHGSMGFLADHLQAKYRPESMLAGAVTIVLVGVNYFQPTPAPPDCPAGLVARYARGRDYHKVVGKRLKRTVRKLEDSFPGESFRSFVDYGPLDERRYGEAAGLGFRGRHGISISAAYGSWFLYGEILTTLEIEQSNPPEGINGACPRSCRKCIDACPTGALLGDGLMDASKCISYLTIENKDGIPEDLRPAIGERIFGCDECQEVCPLNLRARPTEEPDFLEPRAGAWIDLRDILGMSDQADFVRRFAGSPVMRAGLRGMKRNACVAARNLHAIECRPELEKLAAGEDPMLAEHAGWALERM